MQGEIKLAERQRQILAVIIRQHVRTGVPVGSRTVSEKLHDALSPATIRHVMAELEQAGLLSQPHVSAGRVPSDKAYRFYVDRLLNLTGLGAETQRYIDQSLGQGRSA